MRKTTLYGHWYNVNTKKKRHDYNVLCCSTQTWKTWGRLPVGQSRNGLLQYTRWLPRVCCHSRELLCSISLHSSYRSSSTNQTQVLKHLLNPADTQRQNDIVRTLERRQNVKTTSIQRRSHVVCQFNHSICHCSYSLYKKLVESSSKQKFLIMFIRHLTQTAKLQKKQCEGMYFLL